ncbi:asparaginase [Paralcaligenes sp. KSB-10]|uniref:asparaginase n=1 Tax=Paralcaligenes sp. KSB-10 TaxID=2901142 RepID=UPI001E5CAFE0|nr:asparaginase [Paralcaligenes sp. KSB-10]UHL62919.1 asparaginase [Paralcaligenes sp. KSB-10]
MNKSKLPHVVIIGTGGTIASTAPSSTALTDYSVTEGIDSLLKAVPEIAKLARIGGEQLFNIESFAITNKMLLKMATRVNQLLADPDIDGIVITHGTDTLEESAYFLNLTVKSHKPVVLVGAMRPGSAISADGPLNLYNAVLLAAHPQASHLGVLVSLNDRIVAARFVSKTNTTQVDTFRSYEQGCIGHINNQQVHLYQTPTRLHTTQTDFDISATKALPSVDIIYDHQNAGLHFYEASIAAGAQGIVVAACGNGSMSPQARKGARLAVKHKVICVRSSRVGSGIVSASVNDARQRLVSANSLNPQKARILLMLALGVTGDIAQIQSYFDRY